MVINKIKVLVIYDDKRAEIFTENGDYSYLFIKDDNRIEVDTYAERLKRYIPADTTIHAELEEFVEEGEMYVEIFRGSILNERIIRNALKWNLSADDLEKSVIQIKYMRERDERSMQKAINSILKF